jgi:hypothetical protein
MRASVPLGLLLVAACAAPMEIRAQRAPGFEPDRYRTYAWAPARPSGDPRLRDAELERILKGAVDAELQARGYRLVSESPEMIFDYVPLLDREESVGSVDRSFNDAGTVRWTSVTGSAEGVYTQGTIVLDAADAKSGSPLWRGTATSTVEPGASPSRREQRVREAVKKMIQRFP